MGKPSGKRIAPDGFGQLWALFKSGRPHTVVGPCSCRTPFSFPQVHRVRVGFFHVGVKFPRRAKGGVTRKIVVLRRHICAHP